MTPEEARKNAKVMLAFADGKNIQFSPQGKENWQLCKNPLFDFVDYAYRAQPDPQYRPFKSQEECWNEMLKHQPFGWIMDDYKYVQILCVYKDKIELSPDEDDDGVLSACTMKFTSVYEQGYTFADGIPFGTKEE